VLKILFFRLLFIVLLSAACALYCFEEYQDAMEVEQEKVAGTYLRTYHQTRALHTLVDNVSCVIGERLFILSGGAIK
jgi:hypothetical protein